MNGNYQNGKATRVIEFWDGICFITRLRPIDKNSWLYPIMNLLSKIH